MEFNRRLNVVHIVDRWCTGGVQRVITNISEQLIEDGHNVSLISYFDKPAESNDDNLIDEQNNLSGVRIITIGFKRVLFVRAIHNFYEALDKLQPDIIHDHYGGVWSSLFLFSGRWRKRAVFHVHNEFEVIPDSPDRKRTFREGVFRNFLLSRYSQVIAVSDPLKARLVKDRRLNNGKINVVHNSIDAEGYIKEYSKDQNVEDVYDISGKYQFIIGSIGRLVYEKGQDTVIDVLGYLRNSGINAAAMLIGSGDQQYYRQLMHKAEALNVADHCYFTGHVRNTADYYKAMDVFLFCSRQEPFGITLLEAMACRTPIVAVTPEKSGAPVKILQNDYNSIVVNRREPELIADKVKMLNNDSGLTAKLVEGGTQTLNKYTNELMYQSLLKVYNNVEHVAEAKNYSDI